MKKIIINEKEYLLYKDDDNVYNKEEVSNLLTEHFEKFDYILGDYSYNKLRLKGFYEKGEEKTEINDFKNIENYINKYCAYGSKHFILKKSNEK